MKEWFKPTAPPGAHPPRGVLGSLFAEKPEPVCTRCCPDLTWEDRLLGFLAFVRLKFTWLLIVVVALTLSCTNLYGYYKCDSDAKKRVSELKGSAAFTGVMSIGSMMVTRASSAVASLGGGGGGGGGGGDEGGRAAQRSPQTV